ncbi:MAG: DUF4956 domain-containing protein [Anaerolineaceae bacterium]|nr:DUF4956 domain-containing protein [Anaerolineaceae bacterium]MDE0328453.1 DUF4956 domain-containing protein [Anaerolineaceae bacterium]
MAGIGEYLIYFILNLFTTMLVVLLYGRWGKPGYNRILLLVMAGALVFVVIDQMFRAEIGLGVGFGLFAIFALLRFRTVPIRLRDMTYLFTVVALSLVNALLLNSGNLEAMVAVNAALLLTLGLLERIRGRFSLAMNGGQNGGDGKRYTVRMTFDNLALVSPLRQEELLADLRERTGLEPERVRVENINLKAGTARLRLFFHEMNNK